MQIILNLDETLLNQAFQLTNLANQEELIELALQELVRSRSHRSEASQHKNNLLDLAGQVQLASDFDHKTMRATRHAAD